MTHLTWDQAHTQPHVQEVTPLSFSGGSVAAYNWCRGCARLRAVLSEADRIASEGKRVRLEIVLEDEP